VNLGLPIQIIGDFERRLHREHLSIFMVFWQTERVAIPQCGQKRFRGAYSLFSSGAFPSMH
jgi:hypothetical protein